jgi:hypothetical protein
MADTDVRERYGPGDPNEAVIENTARPALAVADPAPLGLAAFALTTFMLSGHTAGFIPDIAWVGLALFYGGMIQLLAGMWEFRNKTSSVRRRSRPTAGSGWGSVASSS